MGTDPGFSPPPHHSLPCRASVMLVHISWPITREQQRSRWPEDRQSKYRWLGSAVDLILHEILEAISRFCQPADAPWALSRGPDLSNPRPHPSVFLAPVLTCEDGRRAEKSCGSGGFAGFGSNQSPRVSKAVGTEERKPGEYMRGPGNADLERGVRLRLHLLCPGFSPQEEEGQQHLLPVSWEWATVREMYPGCSEEVS